MPSLDPRRMAGHVPERFHPTLRRLATNPTLNRLARRPRWGNLRRDAPFSARAGDRGTPVTRHYSDAFVARHGAVIRGDVLEVADDRLSRAHGHDVRRVEIVDIATGNLRATLVADIAEPGSLAPAAYDCAIVPHTLQLVTDPAAAVANLWQSLRPGGHLLLTVPCLGRCDPYEHGTESWRILEPGLRHLVDQCEPAPAELVTQSWGSLRTSLACLLGIAAEELHEGELAAASPQFPVVAALLARKPEAPPATGAASGDAEGRS